MESSVGTLTRQAGGSSKRLATPAGLGGGGGPLLTPARAPARPSGLRRQATLAKGAFVPAALPLFDVSIAVLQSLDQMRASVGEDMVLASTLHVPMHQVHACQAEAYGSPFSAPTLQALQAMEDSKLSDDDREFAACLAAPPELEERVWSGSLQGQQRLMRLASLAGMRQAPSLVAQASLSNDRASLASRLQLVNDMARRADSHTRGARGGGAGAARTRSGDCEGPTCDVAGAAAAAAADDGAGAAAAGAPAGAVAAAAEGRNSFDSQLEGGDVLFPLPRGALAPTGPHGAGGAFSAAAAALQRARGGPGGGSGGSGAPLDLVSALVGVGAFLVAGVEARTAPAQDFLAARVHSLINVRGALALPGSPAWRARGGGGGGGGAAQDVSFRAGPQPGPRA